MTFSSFTLSHRRHLVSREMSSFLVVEGTYINFHCKMEKSREYLSTVHGELENQRGFTEHPQPNGGDLLQFISVVKWRSGGDLLDLNGQGQMSEKKKTQRHPVRSLHLQLSFALEFLVEPQGCTSTSPVHYYEPWFLQRYYTNIRATTSGCTFMRIIILTDHEVFNVF